MNIITLDFETYFDNEYTLSKSTTEAYVRDPRFEVHGCSVRFEGFGEVPTSTIWFTHEKFKAFLSRPNKITGKLVDWSQCAILCHHSQFDGLILNHVYGIKPAFWLDTLSMGRVVLGNSLSLSLANLSQHFNLPAKNVPYDLFKGKHWHELDTGTQRMVADGCSHDVDLTWQIFNLLRPHVPDDEMWFINNTIRCFTEPRLIGDIDMLAEVWRSEQARKVDVLAALNVTAKDLGSDEVFANLLRDLGVEPELKDAKAKPDGTPRVKYAFAKTDPFMQELADNADEELAALAAARLDVKSTLQQTRSERLGWMASRGAMCVYLNHAGAHTLRDSGGDKVNWQNFTRGSNLGKSIKAPAGFLKAKVDKSQIECVAEGQLVLTDRGLIPIERVGVDDFVFDGVEWVRHEGVVCRGEKAVFEYQGLIATLDHIVYLEEGAECDLGWAARQGRDLRKVSEASALRETQVYYANVPRVRDVRSPWDTVQFPERAGGSRVRAEVSTTSDVRRSGDRPERERRPLRAGELTALYEAYERQQQVDDVLGANAQWPLGDARIQTRVSEMRVWPRPDQSVGAARADGGTDYRTLLERALEYIGEVSPLKARGVQKVYDIVNAGPRHRFTVSGVLVSNCRILNYVARQEDVLERFRNKEDPYVGIASQFYGFTVTKEHQAERGTGKQLELSCGYGAGAATIRHTARKGTYGPPVFLTEEQSDRAKSLYRDTHPGVTALWSEAGRLISALAGSNHDTTWRDMLTVQTGYIWGPDGTCLKYPDLAYDAESREWRYRTRKGTARLYGPKLVENVIQWLARMAFKQDIVRIGQQTGLWPVLREHDAGTWLIPDDQYAEKTLEYFIAEMSRAPSWMPGIPLDAEGSLSGGE